MGSENSIPRAFSRQSTSTTLEAAPCVVVAELEAAEAAAATAEAAASAVAVTSDTEGPTEVTAVCATTPEAVFEAAAVIGDDEVAPAIEVVPEAAGVAEVA